MWGEKPSRFFLHFSLQFPFSFFFSGRCNFVLLSFASFVFQNIFFQLNSQNCCLYRTKLSSTFWLVENDISLTYLVAEREGLVWFLRAAWHVIQSAFACHCAVSMVSGNCRLSSWSTHCTNASYSCLLSSAYTELCGLAKQCEMFPCFQLRVAMLVCFWPLWLNRSFWEKKWGKIINT